MNESEHRNLMDTLSEVLMAVCHSGNSRPHWEVLNTACKITRVVTHPEFFEVVANDDRTAYEVRFRRRQGGGYSVITMAQSSTPMEAILAAREALDETASSPRRHPPMGGGQIDAPNAEAAPKTREQMKAAIRELLPPGWELRTRSGAGHGKAMIVPPYAQTNFGTTHSINESQSAGFYSIEACYNLLVALREAAAPGSQVKESEGQA